MAVTISGSDGVTAPTVTADNLVANSNADIRTDKPIRTNQGRQGSVQRDFFSMLQNVGSGGSSNYWGSGYLHLKTNISGMFRVDAQGYDYGRSRAIDSTAAGYVYNGGIINSNIFDNNTSGNSQASFNTMYLQDDGKVCFVLYSAAWYVTQFSLTCYDGNLQGLDAQVLETSMRGDNAKFY